MYGLRGLSLYTSNDLTYNSIRFKKPLDIFLTANSKKRFRRLFIYDFGCKQKALSDSLSLSSSWKKVNTGKPASNINKLMLTWPMIFRDTLLSILLFVNENYCLCTCFTELYIFLLIVCSPSRNFYRCTGCFQPNINIASRNTQNAARKFHSLLKITHNHTQFNK